MALEDLDAGVKALGNAIVAGETPHGNDLLGPVVERVAEGGERGERAGAKLFEDAQETWNKACALTLELNPSGETRS